MTKHRYIFLLLLIFGFVALACSGPGAEEPTAEPTAEPLPTDEPTAEPAPTDEPAPTEAPTAEPTEAAFDEPVLPLALPNIGVSILYPQSWAYDADNNSLTVASTADYLTESDASNDGAVFVAIGLTRADIDSMYPTGTAYDPNDIVTLANHAATLFFEDEADIQLPGATATTIAGQPAGATTATFSADSGHEITLTLVATGDDNSAVIFVYGGPTDSLATYEAALAHIVDSIAIFPIVSHEEETTEVVGGLINPNVWPPQFDFAGLPPAGEYGNDALRFGSINYVRDVVFANEFLYAATGNGLAIWDANSGRLERVVSTLEGLVHNDLNVLELCNLPDPTLLVGTADGMSLIDLSSGNITNYRPAESDMSRNAVYGFGCHEPSNTILIGYSSAYDTFNLDDLSWSATNSFDSDLGGGRFVDFEIVGDLEEIYIAASFGYNHITSSGITFYNDENSNLPEDTITSIHLDANGTLWLGAWGGLMRLNGDGSVSLFNDDNVETWPFFDNVHAIEPAADGTLWIQMSFGEVCQFDPISESCVAAFDDDPGLPSGFAGGLAVAENGDVAYGTDGDGIGLYDGTSWTALLTNSILDHNRIHTLAQGIDGSIWVGTDGDGLYRVTASDLDGHWEHFDDQVLPSGYINSLFPLPNGNLWIGHDRGASLYHADSDSWKHWERGDDGVLPAGVDHITVDSAGRVWLIMNFDGIAILEGEEITLLTVDDGTLPDDSFIDVQAYKDAVFLASRDGLLRFDSPTEWTLLTADNSDLPNNFVSAIEVGGPDHSLFVAVNRDIIQYDPAADIATLLYEFDEFVNSIFVNQAGDMLVGLNDGGAAFIAVGEEPSQGTTADGLPTNFYSFPQQLLIDYLGQIWIAGDSGGLVIFTP